MAGTAPSSWLALSSTSDSALQKELWSGGLAKGAGTTRPAAKARSYPPVWITGATRTEAASERQSITVRRVSTPRVSRKAHRQGAGTARPVIKASPQPVDVGATRTAKTQGRAGGSRARSNQEDLNSSLDARGSALYSFELARASAGVAPDPVVASARQIRELPSADLERAPRPPIGSGYSYPTYNGNRCTLADRFGSSPQCEPSPRTVSLPAVEGGGDRAAQKLPRHQRIQELERGLRAHDVDKMRALAVGTAPLLGVDDQPLLPLPQPVGTVHEGDTDRPSSHVLRKILVAAEMLDERPPPIRLQSESWLVRSVDDLISEAEVLAQRRESEDQCTRVASQLCARAHQANALDVLRMARAVGGIAREPRIRACTRQELLRITSLLLQSLTARLREAGLSILIQVLETMAQVDVGTQDFLDMIMAHVLACQHLDCKVCAGDMALRLATAFGRVASSQVLQLKLEGVEGFSTTTNGKVISTLQQQVGQALPDCSADALALIDHHYLLRILGDTERHAAFVRMADLQLGFREDTQRCLPAMVRLQQAMIRELPHGFITTLPNHVQDYFVQLESRSHEVSALEAAGPV